MEIAMNGKLTPEERERLEEYLVDKYQLYSKLPPGHPFFQKATGNRPVLIPPAPGLLSHFSVDKGVITDRKGRVVSWIDWAQPWYRRWWQVIRWKVWALFNT